MTKSSAEKPVRRWPRRLLIAAAATLAVFVLLGFLVLPPVARHLAESHLGKLLGRRVSVAQVRFNPFSLSLTVEDFVVFEPDARTPFVGFRRLFLNAQWESLYRRAPVVREVRLESPRISVVRLQATQQAWLDTAAYNFSDIVTRLSAGAKEPAEPPKDDQAPALFSINNVHISDGAFTFDDRPLGSRHQITGFDLGVPFVSTLPTFIDTFVVPGLRLTIDGTPFSLAARTKPFKDSLETTVELRASAFDLTRYLPYVPVPLRCDIKSALLDVNVDVSFVRPSSDAARLTAKGRVAIGKVAINEKSGAPLLSLGQFEVVVGQADLLAPSFKIDRITLAGIDVHARRRSDGTLNLDGLAPAPAAPVAPNGASAHPAAPARPAGRAAGIAAGTPRFSVAELTIKDAAVHLRDETVRPPLEAQLDQIGLSVRGLSNADGARAQVTFGMHAAPGGTLKHQGALTLTPLSAQGTVTLDGLEPGRFASYYRDLIAFDVRQGRVRLGATYALGGLGSPVAPAPAPSTATATAPHVTVSEAFVEVADLALRRRASGAVDFFNLHDFAVRGVKLDPGLRTVEVGEIVTHDGRLRAARDERGIVDLTTLVPSSAATPSGPASSPAAAAGPSARTADSAWTVSLGHLDCDGWSAQLDDRMTRPRATLSLSPISMKATGLGTRPGTRGKVDLRLGINKRGRLIVTGGAILEPVSADLKVELRTLEILPLQPYFADLVNLVVTDGTVSVRGRAKLEIPNAVPPPKPLRGTPPARAVTHVTFAGDIDVDNFASVDGTKHEEFLQWKSFHIGQLAVSTVPMSLAIHDVALTDFYSRLMIFPDAHFNVQDILAAPDGRARSPQSDGQQKPPPAPPTATAAQKPGEPTPPAAISIGQITLQGGHVSFSDRLIRPNYSAELTELAGRISGLSADGSTQADVDIRGAVDHSGVLSIVGKANPLAKNLFVDVKVNLKEFELPPTSPYVGKYAGYGISKGKLALALDYHIADRKLDAKNRLLVEQFTFGDKVNSPDATSLPVRLAVAILKDRHGVIDIDLPIAGSLDNPEFKIGRAVLKVLGNLIVKAATAPFSMIASLFGGGDELSRVDFPQGIATVDAKARSRLASLAKALNERPGLSFEIEGSADPVRDREELKRSLYERTLKAQKMLELVQGGAAVSNPESVVFAVSERPRLVEKAYAAAKFPKPRNVFGRPKELPVGEMEKLMMANTLVDDDGLRALAERRATAVREALAKLAPEGATRLFLVAPRLSKPAEGAGNRVEFKLKKD